MKKFLLITALLSIVALVSLHYYLEYEKAQEKEFLDDLDDFLRNSEEDSISLAATDLEQNKHRPAAPQEPSEARERKATERSREHDAEVYDDIRWQSAHEMETGSMDNLAENQERPDPTVSEEAERPVEEKVYAVADFMPQYPGGESALLQYIDKNLKRPSSVQNGEVMGVVVLRFVVKADGNIGQIVVQKGLSGECNDAAVKVVKSLPRFKPGKNNGKPVNVWFTCPIRFIPN